MLSISEDPDRALLFRPHNVQTLLHRLIFSLLLSSHQPTFHPSCPPISPPLHLIFLLWLCLFSLFTLLPSLPPSTQMLQRSLKQRRPPRQMQRRRAPSPRMTKAKSNLKKAELRIWRITQKQKSKKVALCLPSVKAVRFYLFVIFCVAMIFSCWGSFQR